MPHRNRPNGKPQPTDAKSQSLDRFRAHADGEALRTNQGVKIADNQNTLRAAKACGIQYAPIWDEEVFVDHWEYRETDQALHPGDIVLTHFRGRTNWKGTMPDMVRRFLNKVTAEGYAVARLEDYL